MKTMLILLVVISGCAVNKTWDEKGGDREEGTVYYTTDYERGHPPKSDSLTLYWLSSSKCSDWGYDGADLAGEKETECLERDAEDKCSLYRQTLTWHCEGNTE